MIIIILLLKLCNSGCDNVNVNMVMKLIERYKARTVAS